MQKIRKIIHIDMDAFYASVEQRDRPELKGKPVIVGGDPLERGVAAACSYEARKFGIHSAMSSARARKLCPQAVFLRPRFDVYKAVSAEIMEIFYEYTDLVEPLSLDEAFLDVTNNKKGTPSATMIAQEIRKRIHLKVGLSASAGVSFNKFLAKVASDFHKPNHTTVVTPDQAQGFIDRLPIRKFPGVGKVTEKKMLERGVKTGADLKKIDKDELIRLFGKSGGYFYHIAHGEDNRPVTSDRIRKSIGKEITLSEDIDDRDQMIEILERIAIKVETLLKRRKIKGSTITLKMKYFDFQGITRSITLEKRIDEAAIIMKHVRSLLDNTEAGTRKVRLLGISISNFADDHNKTKGDEQLLLPIF
ncbi:MAG: DNA polymerase IV [Thermodesulfobacteriota bacterium]|nr:DNA polymerase IV [Thermodesulfobacteriota bacterium]